MPELKPDKDLIELAKEEVKKFSEDKDDSYNKYQIGDNFKLKLNEKFSEKDNALIGLTEIEDIETLIPKIIINDDDTDKKGRNALINPDYTHIGISQLEADDEKYIVLIFSKCEKKEEEIKPQEEVPKEIICPLTDEESSIYEQIKKFREDPKKFIDKSESFKKKKKRDYENFDQQNF